jgi:hypothetical protein
MRLKDCIVLLPVVVIGMSCNNPVSPPEYVSAVGTVCVKVTGIDTAGTIVNIVGATVNITPKAPPDVFNPGVNLVTNQNGETPPWTSDDFAVLKNNNGSIDPTKVAEIKVAFPGWSEHKASYEFDNDTLRVYPKIAQQP